MPTYRCYLLGADKKIAKAFVLRCDDDADAVIKAQVALAEKSDLVSAEIWADSRRVSVFDKVVP